MDDEKKNKTGKGKGPHSGPAGRRDGKPGGKPFGTKPSRAPYKGKSEGAGGRRPFARDHAAGGEQGDRPSFHKGPRPARSGDGERAPFEGKRPFREKREFSGDRPRGAGSDRPFQKGPRPDRSEGGERAPFEGKRPFREKREFSGDRPRGAGSDRPFQKGPRPDRGEGGERAPFEGRRPFREKREFSADRPRAAGSDRPFQKGPRPDRGEGDRPARSASGDRPPFRKGPRPDHADGGRPFRERRDFGADRPARTEGAGSEGERGGDRPFRKPRPEWKQDGEHGNQRPGRFERGDAREAGGDRPRSFGMKRHAEAGHSEGGKPRSYGTKSHDAPKRSSDRPRARGPEAVEEAGERIAKRLARAGIASRREAEDLVSAGRVRVNGKVLSSPAVNVGPDDRIELDGTEIPPIERTRVFLFHKPAGVVTTNRDPEGRKTVFDVLPEGLPRLMTIGRLDINTEGLLLLTNDGGLARVLELPATGWLRRYRVRVHGEVDEKALAGLKDGIAVDGVFYGAIEASLERVQGTNAWLNIGFREGKNREVKNVLGALGLEVTRLIRVSFGPFQLGELPEGEVQELKGRTLRDQLGERLIEESGANFDAPISKPFSNKADQERRPRDDRSREDHAERPRRESRPVEIGEGGLIKGRKRRREDAREDALGKLSTRPERGGFGGRGDKPAFRSGGPGARGKRDDREAQPERPGQRKANVWMAPGARPEREGSKPKAKDKPAPRSGGPGRSGPRPRKP
ncbi:pseudouridine synthase [Arvimicrobium flavum]|uniref:pseudouridine synthase n=1 Tax=Arvimicrobium flavum TaxID=3393320 RepID=UPI00237B5C11|nr:pseudouridine synthase [Mesorhizobium shangrilense]